MSSREPRKGLNRHLPHGFQNYGRKKSKSLILWVVLSAATHWAPVFGMTGITQT